MAHSTQWTPLPLPMKSRTRRPTVNPCQRVALKFLEPIMKLGRLLRRRKYGDVIGDLNRRRGMIKSQEPANTGIRIKADAPLSEMFGYIGALRTMTSGRGQFSMEILALFSDLCQGMEARKLLLAKRPNAKPPKRK